MSKMNKIVITEFGDESKLAIVEDDLPDPAAGEVQLSVEYSIVSGSDVNMRRGTYPFQIWFLLRLSSIANCNSRNRRGRKIHDASSTNR
jgi:D-arabinose 1-dehydrogenase-like Zn-dependent alcohol dehydrogenase